MIVSIEGVRCSFGEQTPGQRAVPLSIIESDLPRAELVTRLARIRSRTLHRLSDEALSEVEVHNLVLNAVQYRK